MNFQRDDNVNYDILTIIGNELNEQLERELLFYTKDYKETKHDYINDSAFVVFENKGYANKTYLLGTREFNTILDAGKLMIDSFISEAEGKRVSIREPITVEKRFKDYYTVSFRAAILC